MKEIAQAATPMMRQYLETKARYPDAILFFRLGDFYEMFFEDALTASEALQITLTARSKGDDKVPMCGVPYHAARGYVAKLLERGFKVAICDQVEEPPAPGAGNGKSKNPLFRREVTRVVTPGMVLDDQVLDPREASYLGAVALGEGAAGLALLDASTGELRVGEVRDDGRLVDELRRAGVRELILAAGAPEDRAAAIEKGVGVPAARRPEADFERPEERLRRHLGVASLDGFGVGGLALGLSAAAAALAYLSETQRAAPRHVDRLSRLATDEALLLDEATRTNLELERTLSGGRRKGTLLAILDRTVTATGARRLAGWLRYPLTDLAAIGARLDAVAELEASAVRAGGPRRGAPARRRRRAARLAARARAGQRPRPPRARRRARSRCPRSRTCSRRARRGCSATPARGSAGSRSSPRSSTARSRRSRRRGSRRAGSSAAATRPSSTRSSRSPRTGRASSPGSRRRSASGPGSARSRSATTGSSATTSRSRSRTSTSCPPDYERRQTTVGGERFVTPELKALRGEGPHRRGAPVRARGAAVRGAPRRGWWRRRRASAPRRTRSRPRTSLLSLARVAAERGYVRPVVDGSEVLEIEDGRHPVVEALLAAARRRSSRTTCTSSRAASSRARRGTAAARRRPPARSSSSPARTWRASPR